MNFGDIIGRTFPGLYQAIFGQPYGEIKVGQGINPLYILVGVVVISVSLIFAFSGGNKRRR